MSLPRDGLHPVPVETARVARVAFPDGNVYLRLRDELGSGDGVRAREQSHLVTQSDQFIGEIGNNSLGPAIKPRRHALSMSGAICAIFMFFQLQGGAAMVGT